MLEALTTHLPNFWPAFCLALGFPLAMLVLNEAVATCQRRGIAIARTARTIRNLVVPSLAVFVFVR